MTDRAGKPILQRIGAGLAPFVIVLSVVVIFLAIPPHKAVSLLDLRMILVHTMIAGIAALGMTMIIMSGGIDLSVGSAIALASVMAAKAAGNGEVAAIGAAMLTGGLCGLYNGLLIVGLRIPPFIATLGTLGFFRGVAKFASGSRPVSADPGWLEHSVRPIPKPEWLLFAPGVWVMIGLALLTALIVRRTVFGRHCVAIGSNEQAARVNGIRVKRTKVLVYMAAGFLVGVSGLLQFARLTQGDPTVAVGLELDVIAAVVIGGASLSGGTGSIAGTLAGAFLMAYMRNRCTAYGWPNFVQEIIVGHIIIAAVAFDAIKRRANR